MKKVLLFLSLFSLLGIQAADAAEDWELVGIEESQAAHAAAASSDDSFTSLADESEKLQMLYVEFTQATKNILKRYQNHESFDQEKLKQLGRRWRNLTIIIKNPNEFSLSPSTLIPNPKNRIKDDKILNYLYTQLENRKNNIEWAKSLYSYKGIATKNFIELNVIEDLIKIIVDILEKKPVNQKQLAELLQEPTFDLSKYEDKVGFLDEVDNVVTQLRKFFSPPPTSPTTDTE